jgi:1,4-alpha-glucan branching enzyme
MICGTFTDEQNKLHLHKQLMQTMKKQLIHFLTAIIFLSGPVTAQIITVTPPLPTDQDDIVLVFDATQGSQGLMGYTGDVYAHTGVITNLSTGPSNWQHVMADWGVNIPECKLTPLGNDKWQLNIGPSIRQYYNVPAEEEILQLAFVFRSGVQVNGSWLEGKTAANGDIFYDVYPAALNVKITSPDESLVFVQLNEPFTVKVFSSFANNTSLIVDGVQVATTTADSLVFDITPDAYGRYLVKAQAVNDTGMVADSFYYYVRGPVEIAELPEGITEGINFLNSTSAVLCLYAPLKEYAYLLGDFNGWLPDETCYMKQTPDGKRFWLQVDGLTPGKEYVFQYLVDGNIRIGDPYAEKVSDPWNDSYIDPSVYPGLIPYPTGKTSGIATVLQTQKPQYTWKNSSFEPPAKTNLVIYELLIRDFTTEHTFQSVIDTLSYLKSLGINAIEFMPVGEFEGNISWGYNPNYYCAVDKYYGPENKFRELIDSCHSQGIAVIMDVVFNHAFGTSPYVMLYWDKANNRPAADSPYYNPEAKHPASVGFDMNHESADSKYYISKVIRYWLTKFRVDGFRFDLSKGFTQTYSSEYVPWAHYDASRIAILTAYNDTIKAINQSAYLILEHFADNDEESVLSARGMMLWGNMTGNYGNAATGNTSSSNLSGCSYTSRGWAQPNLVGYMESHDEERLMVKCASDGKSWGSYNIKETNTALARGGLLATFFLTIPGPKMIWQFCEMGYDYSINWPSGTGDDRLTPKPPRWDYLENYERLMLFKDYAGLIDLRTTNPLFATTDFSLDVSGALKKIRLRNSEMSAVALGNFDVKEGNITPDFYSTGTWYDYMTGDSIAVTDVNATITLAPGEYKLFLSKNVVNPYSISEKLPGNILVKVAPNPVSDFATISISGQGLKKCSIMSFDANSKPLGNIYNGRFFDTLEIKWKPESKGLNLLRFEIDGIVTVKKVIVL